MRWYVGPWQWGSSPWPAWNPPPGFAGLDLRSLPDHAEGTSGLAIFFGDGANPGSDYTLIGEGSWIDIKPSGRVRDAIPRRAGFEPSGDTLRGVLLSILTIGADPEGLDGARPIIPTTGRAVELHAGERHSHPFVWGSTHANIVRDVMRRDFAEVFDAAQKGLTRDPEIYRRVLDYWCHKLNVADWREFVPVALRQHVPGRLPHATTITESFTGSDGAALGPDLSWTAISGTWQIKSNAATKATTNSVVDLARADSDLSSSDHYAQCVRKDTFTNYFPGPCARVPSTSTKTFYTHFVGGGFQYLMKMVAGTQTNITNSASTNVDGDVYKIECNGSTIKAYKNGAEQLSTTDTAITGGVRCGITAYAANSTLPVLDTFQAADLLTHYTITASGGAFTLAGQAATLKAGRVVTASRGSFALVGQTATLTPGRSLTASAGAFALVGQSVGLYAGRTITAAVGSYSLAGQAAGLLAARTTTASVGAFALTGQSAGLLVGRTVTASVGTFALAGQGADLSLGFAITAGTGVFTASGQSAGFAVARRLSAAAAAFTLTGQAATFDVGTTIVRRFRCDGRGATSFLANGYSRGFRATGRGTPGLFQCNEAAR